MHSKPEQRFAARYVNRVQARTTYGSEADFYAAFQLASDPLADAVVEAYRKDPSLGRTQLNQAIEHGINAVTRPHAALRAYMAHVEEVPSWVDFEQINRGARAYQRLGHASMLILSAWSLMNGYHCAPAIKPLAATGQLESKAPRRLAETSRFVTETAQVDGLRRSGQGYKIAVRVRIMHAHVRAMLLRQDTWDTPAWGLPINQADMLGTIIEFSILVIRGAAQMGFKLSHQDKEDILHLWRYSGHLSGVDADLLERMNGIDRGDRFAELVHLVQPGPDADSLALAAALRKVPGQNANTRFEKAMSHFVTRYHDGLTWAFNGDKIAGDLEIPNRHWRHALIPTRAVVGTMEWFRQRIAPLNDVATRLGNAAVRAEVDRMLRNREPTFHAATSR